MKYEPLRCRALAPLLLGLLAWASCRPASAASLTALYSFTYGTDGAQPQGNVVLDAANNVYGLSPEGGVHCDGFPFSECGTLFKIDPSGAETTLVTFKGGNGAIPVGDLALSGSRLYGATTRTTTADSAGLIFRIRTDGTQFTVLHRFSGPDGSRPQDRPVVVPYRGLYDVTPQGGPGCAAASSGCGVLFHIDASGAYTVLHNFTGGADGYRPGRLVADASGTLYGGTFYGGDTANAGVLYSYVPATGVFTVLHTFEAGADSGAPLLGGIAPDGTIYGATHGAGSLAQYGTLFQLTKVAGRYSFATIWTFDYASSGAVPQSGPLVTGNGSMIDTTYLGASSLYQYANGTLTPLATAATPNEPRSLLGTPAINPATGAIYGTSMAGGAASFGTVYQYSP